MKPELRSELKSEPSASDTTSGRTKKLTKHKNEPRAVSGDSGYGTEIKTPLGGQQIRESYVSLQDIKYEEQMKEYDNLREANAKLREELAALRSRPHLLINSQSVRQRLNPNHPNLPGPGKRNLKVTKPKLSKIIL